MAIGYNVIQPNGIVKKLRVESESDRSDVVDEQLCRWTDYCNRNWISVNYGDPFCSENKVKLFLNGLAYFLMLGNTRGIVTDYKKVADGKREIPISSCPSYIEDLVYGTGSTLPSPNDSAENDAFESTLARLDRKAERYCPNKKTKKKAPAQTRYDKIKRIKAIIGKAEYFYPSVDTTNTFELNGHSYKISDCVSCYSGKLVGADDVLYDMDKVICAVCSDGRTYFFDMNMDIIPNEFVNCVD